MKKAIIVLLLLVLLLSGCSNKIDENNSSNKDEELVEVAYLKDIGASLADRDPDYKLNELIREQFRPEWEWDDDIKDYKNIDKGLIRDENTGLFTLSERNEELEKYATWDGKLGLYISNDVEINHKTGEVITTAKYSESIVKYPDYKVDGNSIIEKQFLDYLEIASKEYESSPFSSNYYSLLSLLEDGKVTKDMLTTDIKNLNELKKKLNEGLETDFIMTMIQLTTNIDMENVASNGFSENLKYWLEEYNHHIELANKGFSAEEAKKLGYLALPYIEDQIKAGKYNEYKGIMLEMTAEYNYSNDKIERPEDYDRALSWFEFYKDDISAIREFISSKLEAEWLY